MSIATANFTHQFLVAMPEMMDPRFAHSITYILDHSDEGAVGLVINKPMDLKVSSLLDEIDMPVRVPLRHPDAKVLCGGPVAPNVGFVLHRDVGDWAATREADGGIYVTSSRDILEAIAEGRGPDDYLVALGYAGWGPGQLEAEMVMNTWLSCPVDQNIIFHLPLDQRWLAAARGMGVDMTLLSHQVGHA